MKYRLLTLAAVLLGMAAANAQQRLAPMARIVAAEKTQAERLSSVRAYIKFGDAIDWSRIKALGVTVTRIYQGVATASVPVHALAELSAMEGVEYVQTASEVYRQMDKAREDTNADSVYEGVGLPQSYTGKGVVIGLVDSGLDYTHPAFKAPDGTLRIKRVWEQETSLAGAPAPQGFGYGAEFVTPEQILAAGADTDSGGHATHVAGIAAGSDYPLGGLFHGVAPDADIVFVALSEDEGIGEGSVNVTDAIGYIFEYAEEVGKPCVINLSLGSHSGPHDGTSLFDQLTDMMQGPGRILVGASGNYGSNDLYKFHLNHTFGGAEDEPLRTFVDFKKFGKGQIEIWGDAAFDVSLTEYNTTTNTEVETLDVYASASEAEKELKEVSFSTSNIKGSFMISVEQANPFNGKCHVVISPRVSSVRSNRALGIIIKPHSEGDVDMWGDVTNLQFTSKGKEGYVEPDGTESTITEVGGTGNRIITVGAYCTRDKYTPEGSSAEKDVVTPAGTDVFGNLLSESGYGPTADGRLKPEVVAPGSFIASSINHFVGTAYPAATFSEGSTAYQYGYNRGTSMAAPFVTGTVAVWLEANPYLTPEDLKTIVAESSRADEYTGTIDTEGDQHWGYGKVDVLAGLKKALDMVGIEEVHAGSGQNATGNIYDLLGRPVEQGTAKRGVYISNGKKVVR